ncbi:MAG: hypothetical protein HRT67_05455 [Flavobacteriaceae bacterium]|nr:hypothetical protein [Flavobacteriaceae bacterium]
MKEIFIFIINLLAINFLCFLPYWFIGIFSKIDNYSKKSIFETSLYFALKRTIYQRFSDDFFRLLFELQALTLIVLLSEITYALYFKMIYIGFTVLSFLYIGYIATMIKIFKRDPVFINDYSFAKTGMLVYNKKLPYLLIVILVCISVVSFVSYTLAENLIAISFQMQEKWIILTILSMHLLLGVISAKKIRNNTYHSAINFSFIHHIAANFIKCSQLKKSLKKLNKNSPYNYLKQIKLKNKPNVLLIFLESYGNFALSNELYGSAFKNHLEKINTSLSKNSWKFASTLSEPPVASGGSWLSHSSILYGAKVKDIAAHEIIFTQTNYVATLESLPKFLNYHGYKTTLTSSLFYRKNSVDWEKVNNMYPYDNIMLYNDFCYKGKKIPVFDSYALPDEYILNYAYQSTSNQTPFCLTISTVNSHYNFVSPIAPMDHWKDYNTKDFQITDGQKKNYLKNYFSSINYQFDYIHKFLLNNTLNKDAIVLLIGDHQPPFITPANIDKNTPIHVISKNNEFINAFKTFDYIKGLIPNKSTQKHESFLSKFIYALNKAYGEDKELELPIFEEGIQLY